MKISKRLIDIAKMVPHGLPCADIGADHGYLVKYLLENNLVPYAYASDNKKGPYSSLKKNLKKYEGKKLVKIDLADGIENLTENYPTIIISGMGGDLIIKILSSNLELVSSRKYLLLSPHGKEESVREFLNRLGFQIQDENIVFDEHYYEIILFKKVEKPQIYSKKELKFGPINLQKKDINFINKYNNLKKIYKNLLLNHNLSNEKMIQLEEEIKVIDEIIDA